jgi:hypothetical protein
MAAGVACGPADGAVHLTCGVSHSGVSQFLTDDVRPPGIETGLGIFGSDLRRSHMVTADVNSV